MTRLVDRARSKTLLALAMFATLTAGAGAQEERLLLLPDDACQPPRLGILGSIDYGRGMVVERVFPFTPAERLGLEPGDVILRVNGFRIRYDGDLERALRRSGGYVRLLVDDVRGRGPVWTHAVSLHRGPRGPVRHYSTESQVARSDSHGSGDGF